MDDSAVYPKVKVREEQEEHVQKVSAFKVKRDRQVNGDSDLKKVQVRSTCVLRPRAVLSSPDNDDMIGNMLNNEKSLASEKPNSELNTPTKPRLCSAMVKAKCKGSKEASADKSLAVKKTPKLGRACPSHVKVESPSSAREANKRAFTKKLSPERSFSSNRTSVSTRPVGAVCPVNEDAGKMSKSVL